MSYIFLIDSLIYTSKFFHTYAKYIALSWIIVTVNWICQSKHKMLSKYFKENRGFLSGFSNFKCLDFQKFIDFDKSKTQFYISPYFINILFAIAKFL